MRAFVALEIPSEHVLSKIVEFQQELSKCGADIKLVERQNLHFTVKFLGEVSEAEADEAGRRLERLGLSCVEVTVMGVGAFPSVTRPNVVWVGVAAGGRELITHLAEDAIGALEGIGKEEQRGFQPHLTLARVRSGRNREALSSWVRRRSDVTFGTVRLSEIKLKSSVLTPRGPVYSDVGVYQLK